MITHNWYFGDKSLPAVSCISSEHVMQTQNDLIQQIHYTLILTANGKTKIMNASLNTL